MKVAFCFLTRGDLLQPGLWDVFFAGASHENYTTYCHPKEPERVTGPLLSGRVVKERVPTRHGDLSLVQATLCLFAQAYADDADNDYFALLSESTIPIVSFAQFHGSLAGCEPRSVVGFQVPAPSSEHHQRLHSVHQPQLFASAFFHHDQWVILHRRHVALLLDSPGLALFEETFAPDEHYFMNALVHLKGVPLDQFVNRRGTFVNWREPEIKTYINPHTGEIVGRTVHPKTYRRLSAAELDEARKGGCWFFRKVDAACDCTAVRPLLAAP